MPEWVVGKRCIIVDTANVLSRCPELVGSVGESRDPRTTSDARARSPGVALGTRPRAPTASGFRNNVRFRRSRGPAQAAVEVDRRARLRRARDQVPVVGAARGPRPGCRNATAQKSLSLSLSLSLAARARAPRGGRAGAPPPLIESVAGPWRTGGSCGPRRRGSPTPRAAGAAAPAATSCWRAGTRGARARI